jgi:hypothetical protein
MGAVVPRGAAAPSFSRISLLMVAADQVGGASDKVFDDKGQLVKAEWVEVTRSAPRS